MGNSLKYPRDCIIENFTDAWIEDPRTMARTAHPIDWRKVDASEFGIYSQTEIINTIESCMKQARSVSERGSSSGMLYADDCIGHTFIVIRRKKDKKRKDNDMNIKTIGNTCKERIGNRIKNRSSSIFDDVLEKLEKKVLAYGFSVLKSAVGIEHIFTLNGDGSGTIKAVTEFIKKYDTNFKKHSIASQKGGERKIANVQFIIRLDTATFLYVAAGKAMGDTEERYFTYNSISDYDLHIYIGGYNAQLFESELVKLLESVNNSETLGIYNVTCNSNSSRYGDDDVNRESLSITFSPMSPRNVETLYFSNNEKEKVIEHIDRFNNHKDFYESRQILYKTGILLYGNPGTGKSSFVKSLATKYGRSIINVNIATLQNIDLNSLAQSIVVDDRREYIVLFEDIDTLFLNRTDSDLRVSENLVINKLLQFLDSNSSPTNVIFIATTNHIERLDEALLREGRFDLKVEVQPLKRNEAVLFGKSFELSDDVIERILDTMDSESDSKGYKGVYNQSKLQARLLACIENKSYEESVKLHCEE